MLKHKLSLHGSSIHLVFSDRVWSRAVSYGEFIEEPDASVALEILINRCASRIIHECDGAQANFVFSASSAIGPDSIGGPLVFKTEGGKRVHCRMEGFASAEFQ